jgi:YD repeat-containing protein
VTPCDSRTYDANGNLLTRSSTAGAFVYAYDYANRLVAVQALVDDGTGGITNLPVATYTYDALGRRVSKTVYSGGLPPSTRQYCYDGTCVIEERENSAVAASYVSSYMLCYTVNSCLSMRLGTQNYFVHTDDQGNALALTSAQGAVVERYDYDDYGAVTFLTSDGTPTSATSSAVGNPYCWGGLRLDAETGLHNDDGGNYFDPPTGSAVRGKIRMCKDQGNGNYTGIIFGNNPWSSGGPVAMKTGTVKFFNEAKGFGFIKEEGGQEITLKFTAEMGQLHATRAGW